MNDAIIAKLQKLCTCEDALEWVKQQDAPKQAWNDCVRGDWMLWLLGKFCDDPLNKSRKRLVLCTAECARLALKYVPAGEHRPLLAIASAENWAHGKATLEDVRLAADAADVAIDVAGAYAFASGAFAVANLPIDAAAYNAVDAADAAAYAAAYTAYTAVDAARENTLRECADIVRKHYPEPPDVL